MRTLRGYVSFFTVFLLTAISSYGATCPTDFNVDVELTWVRSQRGGDPSHNQNPLTINFTVQGVDSVFDKHADIPAAQTFVSPGITDTIQWVPGQKYQYSSTVMTNYLKVAVACPGYRLFVKQNENVSLQSDKVQEIALSYNNGKYVASLEWFRSRGGELWLVGGLNNNVILSPKTLPPDRQSTSIAYTSNTTDVDWCLYDPYDTGATIIKTGEHTDYKEYAVVLSGTRAGPVYVLAREKTGGHCVIGGELLICGCASGGCESGVCSIGSATLVSGSPGRGPGSFTWTLNLGNTPGFDGGSGSLMIGGNLGTPGYDGRPAIMLPVGPGGRIIPNSADAKLVDQIVNPEGAVNIREFIHESNIKLIFDVYHPTDIETDPTDGRRFVAASGKSPFVTYEVDQPTSNKWQVTEFRGGTSTTSTVELASGVTTQTVGSATRQVKSSETAIGDVRTETYQVFDNSTLVYQEQRIYTSYPGIGKLLTSMSVGNGPSETRTTNYTYYTTVGSSGYGQIETMTGPYGGWEKYTYDSMGRVSIKYSNYIDQPLAGMNANNCATTEFIYSDVGYSFPAGINNNNRFPSVPRVIINKIQGNEVSRNYRALKLEGDAFTCQFDVIPKDPGGPFNDLSNQMTYEEYWDKESYGFLNGRLKKRLNIDGTAEVYDYDYLSEKLTVTTDTGEPYYSSPITDINHYANFYSIQKGHRVITEMGEQGEVLSVVGNEITAVNVVAEARMTDVTYDYKNEDLPVDPTRRTYRQIDNLISGNGNFSDVVAGCCGIESETDRDGVETEYFYDVHKRPYKSIRLNITSENVLNGAGNVLVEKRIGTDASVQILNQYQYNTRGSLITHTNALNGVTSIVDAVVSGKRKVTTTYPDGGQEVQDYFKDGSLYQVTGSAASARQRFEYGTVLDGGKWRMYVKVIALDSSNNPTSEWVQTLINGAGQNYKTISNASTPTKPSSTTTFNRHGKPSVVVDQEGKKTLYAYDGLGRLEYMAEDLDNDGVIDYGGSTQLGTSDRVIRNTFQYGTNSIAGTTVVFREIVDIYTTTNSIATQQVRKTETSVNGRKSWVFLPGITNPTISEVTYPSEVTRKHTTTLPDGTIHEDTYVSGRLTTRVRKHGSTIHENRTFYYDPHGRVESIYDARSGEHVFGYNSADLMNFSGSPETVNLDQSTVYDGSLRAVEMIQADGASQYRQYYPTGLLKAVYGSGIIPREYTYDTQSRMKTLKTYKQWSGSSGVSGVATTTWNYDAYRGWLAEKVYDNNQKTQYAYYNNGQIKTRTWARGVSTTYTYETNGRRLKLINYSDTTPDISFEVYDRRGRLESVAADGITTTLTYNNVDRITGESHSGGILNTLNVQREYDSTGRLDKVHTRMSTTVQNTADYGFNAGRLHTITSNGKTLTYGYLANSRLANTLTYSANTLVTTKEYDALNRLRVVASNPSGHSLDQVFEYIYDQKSRKSRVNLADGSYWKYSYDELGQVQSAKRYWENGEHVGGQQFEYVFDDAGNRVTTRFGGDEDGAGLVSSTYSSNGVNQYTSRTVPGSFTVSGVAGVSSSVTVDGSAADRQGEYFWRHVPVSNSSAAVFKSVGVTNTISGGGSITYTGTRYVAKTPEAYTYDLDGNIKTDGRWNYDWDGENRLIKVASLVGPSVTVDYDYDYLGRRIQKIENSTAVRYLYDGWNLIGEFNSSLAITKSYIWGKEIDQSQGGTGGIGGLVMIRDHGTGRIYYPTYDGNGNVMGLVDSSDGKWAANYEYGPFGEVIRMSGSYAAQNPFRFSTKYQDGVTGFIYFGYRYYNPTTGRWLNRDPIAEDGGVNIYAFVGNGSLNSYDILGLYGGGWGALQGFKNPYGFMGNSNSETLQDTVEVAKGMYDWANGVVEGVVLTAYDICSEPIYVILSPIQGLGEGNLFYGSHYRNMARTDAVMSVPGHVGIFAAQVSILIQYDDPENRINTASYFIDIIEPMTPDASDSVREGTTETLNALSYYFLRFLKGPKGNTKCCPPPRSAPSTTPVPGSPALTGTIRESFEGGKYTRMVLDEDLVTYRASNYVPDGKRVGDFFGDVRPRSSMDAEELYNIQKWGNNAWNVGAYRIPAGTEVFCGRVAGGAANQFYIPNAQQLLQAGKIELLDVGSLFMRMEKALP